jgi:hypothetical protein
MTAMSRTTTFLLAAAIAGVLAGCGKENPPAKNEAAASAPKTAPTGSRVFQRDVAETGDDFIVSGVTLSVAPNPFNSCDFPKGRAIVNVGLDSRPAGIRHVQIWIQGSNGKQLLWGQAPGISPVHPTGPWMSDGSKLLLVNADDGKLIAAQTIHATPCK